MRRSGSLTRMPGLPDVYATRETLPVAPARPERVPMRCYLGFHRLHAGVGHCLRGCGFFRAAT